MRILIIISRVEFLKVEGITLGEDTAEVNEYLECY
jgi:hypothetical protein